MFFLMELKQRILQELIQLRETQIENKKKTKSLTFSATRVILLMRHLEDQHSMYAHTHAQKLD